MERVSIIFLAFLLPAAAAAQDKKPEPPKAPALSQAAIDAAIKKGAEYLKRAPSPAAWAGIKDSDELILYTLLVADVPDTDPAFQKYFTKVTTGPLEKTYKVALQAMTLEEMDRVKHQGRIAMCGQFLVDNQCQNGQWGYGEVSEHVKEVEPPKDVATSGTEAPREGPRVYGEGKAKPKVRHKIAVKKMKDGPETGDNSNTQYAALGLRACYDSGIAIPEGVVLLAVKWWRESQHPPSEKEGVYGGRGWNYKTREADKRGPYHAMTAGGTACLVIYDYMLKREWENDSFVKSGMKWLTDHFRVDKNYYYMYGLERVGILYGTPTLGTHDWYQEGARLLLKEQKADGSWGDHKDKDDTKEKESERNTQETCFAILFLKKATRPLVASEDVLKKK
jgi:hypothetical protein